MTRIIITLIVLAVLTYVYFFFLSGKLRRRIQHAREKNMITNEMFRAQSRRYDWLEENCSGGDSPEYQELLETEIRFRLALAQFDPKHPFIRPVKELLQEATDKEFEAWVRSELDGVEKKSIRFVS